MQQGNLQHAHTRTSKRSNKQLSRVRGWRSKATSEQQQLRIARTQTNQKPRLR